jgi:hypothetical protein
MKATRPSQAIYAEAIPFSIFGTIRVHTDLILKFLFDTFFAESQQYGGMLRESIANGSREKKDW